MSGYLLAAGNCIQWEVIVMRNTVYKRNARHKDTYEMLKIPDMATFAMKLWHVLSSKSLFLFFFLMTLLEGCSSNFIVLSYCQGHHFLCVWGGGNCSFSSLPYFFSMCYQSPLYEIP